MSGFDQFQQKLGDDDAVSVPLPPLTGNKKEENTKNTHAHTQSQSGSRAPSPNRGQTVPETDAIPPHRESQAEWRARNHIDPAKQIRLVKVSHMRYRHPDLALMTKFLRDFGMHVVKRMEGRAWFAGYGADQYVCKYMREEKRIGVIRDGMRVRSVIVIDCLSAD